MSISNRDGRGTTAGTEDRILVLENRAYMPSATRNATAISFELFPNPARQQVTLRLPALGAHVTVCDLLGRRLREQTVPGTTTLDLTGLPASHCLVVVATAVGTATKRIIGPWQFFAYCERWTVVSLLSLLESW